MRMKTLADCIETIKERIDELAQLMRNSGDFNGTLMVQFRYNENLLMKITEPEQVQVIDTRMRYY